MLRSPARSNPDAGTAPVSALPIEDSFADTTRFTDLSALVSWGRLAPGTTAFQLGPHNGQQSISLIREGPSSTLPHAGLAKSTDLRGFSSIDYDFGKPVDHRVATLSIEFDVAWDEFDSAGERGKLHVIVLHDYPGNGVVANQDQNLAETPFGRPAYTLVLRNGDNGAGGGQPFLFYGGGSDLDGSLAIFQTMWWLPGFVSPPGGGTVGVDEPYPQHSWIRSPTAVATTEWQRFRFVIAPDRMQFFQENNLLIDFPLPRQSAAPLYRYFEQFEALHIYWRGVHQVYLSNLRIAAQ
ncbi:MAG: hypothetical protein MJE77_19905 [Proteobacteria bacterium]|nr:hypothetical protein [Pseudomonadota bacterium]